MSKQIQTIGFRNALYTGQTCNSKDREMQPRGIGILIDDMFLTCLSTWTTVNSESVLEPNGPTVILYPHREALFMDNYPKNNNFLGFWCYLSGQYRIYGNREKENFAVLHLKGNVVAQVSVSNTQFSIGQQFTYESQQEKWQIIEEILKQKWPEDMRTLQRFVNRNFVSKINASYKNEVFIQENNRNDEWFGIFDNGEGIGVCLKKQGNELDLGTTGFYRNFQNKYLAFGRKYHDQINSNSYQIREGIFESEEVYKFQFSEKRPVQSYKTSRKFFKQTTNFCNKFVRICEVDETYKKLNKLSREYELKVGTKYGQRIIEGVKKAKQIPSEQQIQEGSYRATMWQNDEEKPNRVYNLNEARNVIESEINKKRGGSNRVGVYHFHRSEVDERQPITARNMYDGSCSGYGNSSRKRYEYLDNLRQNEAEYQPRIIKNSPYNKMAELPYNPRVNQFTLYSPHSAQTDRYDEIIRQKRRQLTEQIQIEKDLYQIQYQIEKERELRFLKNIQNENLFVRNQLQQPNKMGIQRLHTFGAAQPVRNDTSYTPPVDRYGKVATGQSWQNQEIDGHFKRKYLNKYKYTDDKLKILDSPNKMQLALQKSSPITNLYSQHSRPVSRSPAPRITQTIRRNFNYMD